jgi:putative cofactor-binding repeat protein
MKSTILFFFIALCSFSFTAQAQVTLSGALSGNYPTLWGAFETINNGGGSGEVTVTITENHTLTTTAVLQQTGYTVTIQPSGNRTVSGSMNAPLILFNGADNAILDGIALSGANKLTVTNTNTGSAASALRLSNDASNNIIRYCTFQGATRGNFNNGVVNISTAGQGTTGCDNNQIIHNHIREAGANLPQNGITMEGASSSALNNNNVISDNHICNFFTPNTSAGFTCGIYSYRYNTGTTIENNHFYLTNPAQGSGNSINLRAIEFDDGVHSAGTAGGFTIHNNFIGGSAPDAAGAPLTLTHPTDLITFMGIYIAAGNAGISSLQGNIIRNISLSCLFNKNDNWLGFNGIHIYGGRVNVGTTTGNVIGSPTGAGSITVNANFTGSGSYRHDGINNQSNGQPVAINNNTIGSIKLFPTGVAGNLVLFGIYTWSNDNIQIHDNLVGSDSTANSILVGSNTSLPTFANGIMADGSSCSITGNTVGNITVNSRGELNGIMLWNYLAGKTQTCTGNTVRNLSTAMGNAVDVTGILAVSNSSSTITYNLNIDNNSVSDLSVGAGSSGECDLFGIWVIRRGNAPVCYVNGSISGNSISNLTSSNTFSTAAVGGIVDAQLYNGASGMAIHNNNISNLTASQQEPTIGIVAYGTIATSALSAATKLSIKGNTIHSITNNRMGPTGVSGIEFSGKNIDVAQNRIYGLLMPNGDPSSFLAGISCSGGNGTGAYQINNNMISLGTGVANSAAIRGIVHKSAAAASLNIWYNSVFVGGEAPAGGTNNTACFDRLADTPVNIRNNILYNARTGGGKHIAISNLLGSPSSGWNSDNNFLVSAQPANLGLWGPLQKEFSAWQTISNGDGASVGAQAFVNSFPESLFINTSQADLSLNTAIGSEASLIQNSGTPVAVTVDFFNGSRSPTTPDPGAHEFENIPAPPIANFNADMATACPDEPILFTDQSEYEPASWLWSFPGGSPEISTEQNPVVSYSAPGSYDVTLTVFNALGQDSITKTNHIQIIPPPVANFTYVIGGNTVTFTNTSSDATDYHWDFGDGATSTEAGPVHSYAGDGAYMATLIATNDCGSDTIKLALNIMVSTLDPFIASKLSVYPNPGDGLFWLEIEGRPSEELEVTLFDLLGNAVYAQTFDFQQGQIHQALDVRELPPAAYVLRVRSGSEWTHVKVFIQ